MISDSYVVTKSIFHKLVSIFFFVSEFCVNQKHEMIQTVHVGHHTIQGPVYVIFFNITIRSDIAYSVNKLSRFLSNSIKVHLQGATRILRYLKSTFTLLFTLSP